MIHRDAFISRCYLHAVFDEISEIRRAGRRQIRQVAQAEDIRPIRLDLRIESLEIFRRRICRLDFETIFDMDFAVEIAAGDKAGIGSARADIGLLRRDRVHDITIRVHLALFDDDARRRLRELHRVSDMPLEHLDTLRRQ